MNQNVMEGIKATSMPCAASAASLSEGSTMVSRLIKAETRIHVVKETAWIKDYQPELADAFDRFGGVFSASQILRNCCKTFAEFQDKLWSLQDQLDNVQYINKEIFDKEILMWYTHIFLQLEYNLHIDPNEGGEISWRTMQPAMKRLYGDIMHSAGMPKALREAAKDVLTLSKRNIRKNIQAVKRLGNF